MAKTPFSTQVTSSTPYTVPAGKHFVFCAFEGTNDATNNTALVFSGTLTGYADIAQNIPYGPFVIPSGTSIATYINGHQAFLSGYLYDN